MRYQNTRTGAIVDSPFKFFGQDWKEFEANPVEEVAKTEDFVEEEIDLASMTNAQLEEFAKEQEIELTAEDKKNKESRIEAIVTALG